MYRVALVGAALTAACTFDPRGLTGTDGPVVDARPAPDAAPDAGAPIDAAISIDASWMVATIRIEALIDGRSTLTLRRNTARWHHFEYAAPGRHEGAIEPTVIDGFSWFPSWPDVPTLENRDCDCDSQPLSDMSFALPPLTQTATRIEIATRQTVEILEQPTPANDFALVIELDDREEGGSDQYIFDVEAIVTRTQ